MTETFSSKYGKPAVVLDTAYPSMHAVIEFANQIGAWYRDTHGRRLVAQIPDGQIFLFTPAEFWQAYRKPANQRAAQTV